MQGCHTFGWLVRFCSKLDMWVCAYRFQSSSWHSCSFLSCPFSISSVDEKNVWAAERTQSFHGLAGNGGGRQCQGLRWQHSHWVLSPPCALALPLPCAPAVPLVPAVPLLPKGITSHFFILSFHRQEVWCWLILLSDYKIN